MTTFMEHTFPAPVTNADGTVTVSRVPEHWDKVHWAQDLRGHTSCGAEMFDGSAAMTRTANMVTCPLCSERLTSALTPTP